MGIKLLIADDEDTIRNGMQRYISLHTERFEKIYLAENGEKALEIVFQYKPDIILLDVQMPYLNGIEVMKEMRKAGLEIPVIILSGFDEFKYAQQALKYGAKDYMLKPTRSSDILAKLNEIADELFGREEKKEEDGGNNYLVSQAVEFIKEHYFDNLTLGYVAEKLGISPGYLSTLFTTNMNMSFVDYLNETRIEYACVYLKQNTLKTYEIAYKVGFRDEKYFSKVFKKIKNVSPSEFRKSKSGE